MSALINDLRDMGGGLRSRIRRFRTMIERTTAVPLVVRGAVWGSSLVATAVAVPVSALATPSAVPLLFFGALAAVAPRTRMVTLAVLVPAAAWVIATATSGAPASPVRLLLLAAALYLVHSTAALAAQLPYDAIVSPAVLRRWFARVGLVLGATAVVGMYVLLAGQVLGGAATLLATTAGLAVAVGLAAFLIHLLRRG